MVLRYILLMWGGTEYHDIEGVLTNKVVYGTHRGNPALDQDAVSAAISIGMSVARTLAVQGIQAVGLGNIR